MKGPPGDEPATLRFGSAPPLTGLRMKTTRARSEPKGPSAYRRQGCMQITQRRLLTTQWADFFGSPKNTLTPNFLGKFVDEFLPQFEGGKGAHFSSSWKRPLADLSLRVFRGLGPAASLMTERLSRKSPKG